METLKKRVQPSRRRSRPRSSIAAIVALAVVAVMSACAGIEPGPVEPTPTPVPGGGQVTPRVVAVTWEAAKPGCTVKPFELTDVSVGGLVTFANDAGIQSVTFDFPPELFGPNSVTVPAGLSVTFVVRDTAQPAKGLRVLGQLRPRRRSFARGS